MLLWLHLAKVYGLVKAGLQIQPNSQNKFALHPVARNNFAPNHEHLNHGDDSHALGQNCCSVFDDSTEI